MPAAATPPDPPRPGAPRRRSDPSAGSGPRATPAARRGTARRRDRLRGAAAGERRTGLLVHPLAPLLLLLLTVACERSPLEPSPGAHLVLISLDTLRADHLSCYGYERATSPHLDALAAESILFEDVLACASSTAPSHMTLMTGVLPRVHGIANESTRARAPAAPLLAELLRDAGYATNAFADGGQVDTGAGFDRGFQRFESRYEWWDRKLDRLEDWLPADPDQPQFLFVHTYGVHAPYLPGPGHDLFGDTDTPSAFDAPVAALQSRLTSPARQDHELRQLMDAFWPDRKAFTDVDRRRVVDLYDGAIHRVDAGVGRLLETLDRAGWLDRAWIVVTSDHGEAFGEHGTYQHRQVHQEELAVPLIIRPPGGLPGGRRVATPISQLDLAPTLLAALGLDVPSTMQGAPLLPLDGLRPAPRFATGGEGEGQDVVIESRRKLIASLERERAAFDLAADPGEQQDLLPPTDGEGPVPATPGWLDRLRGRLAAMRREAGALRKLLGDPLDRGPLSEEQIRELEALGYLQGSDR